MDIIKKTGGKKVFAGVQDFKCASQGSVKCVESGGKMSCAQLTSYVDSTEDNFYRSRRIFWYKASTGPHTLGQNHSFTLSSPALKGLDQYEERAAAGKTNCGGGGQGVQLFL